MNLYDRLNMSKFRSSFYLKKKDKDYVETKGIDTIRLHAYDFVNKRLKPEIIENDGKQTPYRGHPVFIAQHHCACCCRGCLEKWHGIKNNHELTDGEVDYIVNFLIGWIESQVKTES